MVLDFTATSDYYLSLVAFPFCQISVATKILLPETNMDYLSSKHFFYLVI